MNRLAHLWWWTGLASTVILLYRSGAVRSRMNCRNPSVMSNSVRSLRNWTGRETGGRSEWNKFVTNYIPDGTRLQLMKQWDWRIFGLCRGRLVLLRSTWQAWWTQTAHIREFVLVGGCHTGSGFGDDSWRCLFSRGYLIRVTQSGHTKQCEIFQQFTSDSTTAYLEWVSPQRACGSPKKIKWQITETACERRKINNSTNNDDCLPRCEKSTKANQDLVSLWFEVEEKRERSCDIGLVLSRLVYSARVRGIPLYC